MKLRSQAGVSLVELIVTLGILSILLIGVSGVVLAAGSAYNAWSHSILSVSQANAYSNTLVASIQQDSHRYVLCASQRSALDFCLPDGRQVLVRYQILGRQRDYFVARDDGNGPIAVARGLDAVPTFAVHIDQGGCGNSDPAASGTIGISGLRYQGEPTARPSELIYFASPECVGP